MKVQKLFRKIHHWGSFIVAIPLLIMIGAGILLMLKKQVEWIQPPSQKGIERSTVPMATMQDLFDAARTVEKAGFTSWEQLERADLKPGKGIIKFVSSGNWEVQVDTHTAEVLQIAQRRSDVIESIHDGSYFADWIKLWVFLPAGIGLFILWLTGMYKKIKNRRKAIQTRF
jgi:uncharacterized iron-regulated membrane protein